MAEKIIGLDELNKKLEALKGIKTSEALLAGALTLQGFSQRNAPVDTGYLRSSASSEIVGDGSEVKFSTDYAWYQEVGTENFEGRFYVTRAIDEHEKDVIDAVAKRLKNDMGDLIK